MPISNFDLKPLKECLLKRTIHSIEMRLSLSRPNLGHHLEANYIGIGSKLPTDFNKPKERQEPNWLEDFNKSKELHQLIEEPGPLEPEQEPLEQQETQESQNPQSP